MVLAYILTEKVQFNLTLYSMPIEIWYRKELKDLVLSELSLKNLKEIPGIKLEIVEKHGRKMESLSYDMEIIGFKTMA